MIVFGNEFDHIGTVIPFVQEHDFMKLVVADIHVLLVDQAMIVLRDQGGAMFFHRYVHDKRQSKTNEGGGDYDPCCYLPSSNSRNDTSDECAHETAYYCGGH